VETAASETLLGGYKDPTPSSAGTGLTHVDLGTFEWLRDKYKNSRYSAVLLDQFGIDRSRTVYAELRTSPLMAMLFSRLRYLAVSELIPATREARAAYWKKYYNTSAGEGTPPDFIAKTPRAGADVVSYTHLP
ncbi:hypothetical protein AAER89_29600, partial [Klebsiella pneumoniae]|uniref:hypothetical protein n=1 Tax=Klebsiella pneumoniae TaxID=573 RepID=UPI0031359F8B